MTDPRKAKSLGEAALNPDGTYNGIRALSWLSAALYPGAGLSEDEVRQTTPAHPSGTPLTASSPYTANPL